MAAQTPCPDREHLRGLLDGTLPTAELAALNDHLEQCAKCQQALEALVAGKELWAGAARHLGEAAPSGPALGKVVAGLKGESVGGETLAEPEGRPAGLDFLQPPAKPAQLGRLKHYEVVGVLGRGGFGIVLKAFDPPLNRFVAIKVLSPSLATSAAARKRFAREARATAAVVHEHVVAIHAVDEANDPPFLVMQCILGKSLQERLDHGGPLEIKEVLRIGMQIASGLAAAHKQGLIHRDIKPANILLENGVERVKLTDFGLARAVDDASLSQNGVIAGTPQYMAPEQARGEYVDHRADLFSLGSVLYAMCTGRPPFRASTTMGVLKRLCDEEPRPAHEINSEVPDWLEAIIAKLHAKAPNERFQSAEEVADLLGQYLAHPQRPGQAPPPRVVVPQRRVQPAGNRRFPVWALALVLLLLLAPCLLSCLLVTAYLSVRVAPKPPVPAQPLVEPAPAQAEVWVDIDDPEVIVVVQDRNGQISAIDRDALPLRLNPGWIKLTGSRKGKPVELDPAEANLQAGERLVVRLRKAQQAEKKDQARPFVILARDGKAERAFATLAEAVALAADWDAIEVKGNGPFVTPPLNINGKALTIRAAAGSRPVIELRSEGVGDGKRMIYEPLIRTTAPLTVEGLELQHVRGWRAKPPTWMPYLVVSANAPFRAANCRFLCKHPGTVCVNPGNSPLCEVRNCEFIAEGGGGIEFTQLGGGHLTASNCLFVGKTYGVELCSLVPKPRTTVQLTGNLFLVPHPVNLVVRYVENGRPPDENKRGKWFELEVRGNLFTGSFRLDQKVFGKPLPAAEAEALLRRLVDWREGRNLYSLAGADFLSLAEEEQPMVPTRPRLKLADWKAFWGMTKLDSIQGQAQFVGGDVLSKVPEKLTPADCRLKEDSPGKGGGEGGRDLGADVDLVGPGMAYERWKQTAEYPEWLKGRWPPPDRKK